jgi:small subunit ribosomal protein S1
METESILQTGTEPAENEEITEVSERTETVVTAEAAEETKEEVVAEKVAEEKAITLPTETMDDYARELEASFRKIAEGDIISGTVIAVSEEEVILDLRYYTQGIIKAGDLSKAPDFSVMDDVRIGETIEATVMQMDDGQGNIQLSRIEANQVLAWDKLEQYRTEGRDFLVKISGITNGGAICYLEDMRAFIPASQLSLDT